ncbi:MAG TPA: carboxypeptidase-like regulatory domain-containing protein, partial [bacterium]|nr:carboxypeptidase-like regulatory domain-containing protein [bacterium]
SFTIQPAPQVFDAWDAPALGVRLTLYYIDNNQLKQIWLSPTKRQKNPQRTGFNGKYQFYVEPGRYLLDAEAVGFENTSTEITMTERGYITQSIQLAYVADKDIKNIAVDPSVMGLIDALLERLKLLSKDEDVIELTNKLLKPASWLIMISAIFMYIFSLLMQLGVSLATLPNLGVHGLQFLVQLFNGKSNKKKWGKVYEHFTHDPIPLAAVMLFHEPDHKLDQMTLTEIDGTYGFPEIEGSYSLFVSKKGFKFPPAATKHVYKGEVFKTMKGTLPKMNIAVDYDLEAEKANAGFLMAQKMFSGGHLFLSLIGFGLSLWTLIVKFSIASFALLLLYVWLISSRITTILTNSRVHQTVHQVKLGKKDEKAPPAHKSI